MTNSDYLEKLCELVELYEHLEGELGMSQGCIDDTATAHGQARGIHSSPPTTQEQAQMKWVAYP